MKTAFGGMLGLGAMVAMAGVQPAHAAGDAASCTALAQLSRPDLPISRAEMVAGGTLPQDNPARAALTGAARASMGMPPHCLVQGKIDPRIGVDGQAFGSSFELRLPMEWNGKMLFQGGGGMDGSVAQAVGAIPLSGATAPPALNRGYAVVSTDSGHHGDPRTPGGPAADGSFARDQQARIDLGYGALGAVSHEAKLLIATFYGRPLRRSYFMGCSNGGRSAMAAAQRFPLEFDGVIAGNPAFHVSQGVIAAAWDTRALLKAAPLNDEGKPVLSRAFSSGDLDLVSRKVLAACDGADGLVDGSIDAPKRCHFDPAALRCPAEKTADCLSGAQVDALQQVFSGAKDSQGRQLYPGWNWDSGIGADTWRSWKLGSSQTDVPNARDVELMFSGLRTFFMTPPAPTLKLEDFDFDTALARTAETRVINDMDATDLSSFTGHGGRMILYHGYSDPVFSARDIIDYYERLASTGGGLAKVLDWARLFMVPGMTHCGGGPSLDDFDPLQALDDWVEKGTAPARLVARGTAFPGRSRPHCPYPQEPRYRGQGDTNDAASFDCVQPR